MVNHLPEMLGLSWFQLGLIPCIFILGGAAKGALGFGLPFVTVSIIPLFAPLDVALAVNALVLPISNFLQYTQSGLVRPTFERYRLVVVGILLGAPIGAYLLSAMDIHIIELLLGLFVMCFVFVTLFNPSLKVAPRSEKSLGLTVGLSAGVIGTMTTVNGPVFIMYLLGLHINRREMLASLGLLFIVSGLCFTVFFSLFGILTIERALLGVACAGFAMLGMRIGDWLVQFIDREFFRKLVLCGLFILGFNIFLRGLG